MTHSLVMDQDSWRRIKKAKVKSDKLGSPNNFVRDAIEDASKEAFNILTNKPVTIKWDESGNGSYDIVGPGNIGRVPTIASVPEESVGEESDTSVGDSILAGIVNPTDFRAAYTPQYNKAPKEQIDVLIPYIRSLFKGEIKPKNYFTHFEGASLKRPSWFAQEDWDKAPTIGGNKFGWSKGITNKGAVTGVSLDLGDQMVEYLARTAIGESAAGDVAGQKAVIDVFFTRSFHQNKIFQKQQQNTTVPKNLVKSLSDKSKKTAFFSNVLKRVA